MSYSLSPLLKPRFFVNATNKPLVGGKLYTYLAETTTPAPTYSNDTGTPNTNPIILDANGECNLYLNDDVTYRLILKDVQTSTKANANKLYTLEQMAKLPFVDVKEVENEIYKSDNR